MNKQSFYKNILKAFGLVSVIYILVITAIFGYKNITFKNRLTKVSDQNLLTVMTNELTTKFNSGISLTNSLFIDERVKNFATQDNTYYYSTGVQSAISYYYSVFYSNNFEMMVYHVQKDMAISGKESGSSDLISENLDLSKAEIRDILANMESSVFLYHPLTVTNEKDSIRMIPGSLYYIKKYRYSNDNEIFVFTRFDLNTMFHSLFETDRSYILTCDKIPVFAEIQPELLPMETAEIIAGRERLYVTDLSSTDIHMETAEVPIGGAPAKLSLYLMNTSNTFLDQASFLFSTDIVIMILLLLIGSLLVLVITRVLYRPVQNMLSELGIPKSSADAIDEFKSVEHYLNIIKESNEELNTRLEEQKSQFQRGSLLRDLFYGIYISEDVYIKMLNYGLNLNQNVRQIVIAGLVMTDDLDTMNELTRLKLQQAVSIFKDLLGDEVNYELFELSNLRFACYILSDTDVFPLVEETKSAIKLGLSMEIHMFTRNVSVPLAKVGQQSLSLLEILDDSLNNNFELSALTASIKYYYPTELEQMVITAAVQRKFSYAQSLLDIILYENLNNRNLNKESRNAFIINMASTLEKICSAYATNINIIFPEGEIILLSMKTAGSSQELLKIIKEEFSTLFLALDKTLSQTSEDGTGAKRPQPNQMAITQYIKDNYTWDVSLADIAEHFNLTPAYMSYIFKENTSRNFKDYLNWYRVEQAKAIMLSNPKVLVKDVSEMVGCNSIKTFIRIFKKYENTTPNQFVDAYNNRLKQ